MGQTFVYFQPEYVGKFHCDGQACNANCCKYWKIDIDKPTFKKYAELKPKEKSQAIIEKLKFDDKTNMHFVKLSRNGFCPFLTEDNWCSIQKSYGADYLSDICMTYPRVTYNIGDFYERSLMLTCPVAAELILNQTEPMAFEQIEISTKEYMETCRDKVRFLILPKELRKYLINVQYAVISLIQERRLSIDQRLIVVGYFLDQLEELVKSGQLQEIETLALIYTSEDFMREQVPSLVKSIEFNVKEYIKIMFEVFGVLYGDKKNVKADAQNYLDFLAIALEIKLDKDGTASIAELSKTYTKHSTTREEFLEKYSIIFEHYIVQEFFSCLYPWHVEGSISLNYGVFLVTYKILELIGVSMAIVNEKLSKAMGKNEMNEKRVIDLIRWFVQRLDHGADYLEPIKNCLQEKDNTIKIMRSLLQG